MAFRWRAAIDTLAKLHRVNVKETGLESFGKPSGFYNRQLATLKSVSKAQSRVADVDTGELVGELPHFSDVTEFFSNPRTQPQDRSTLVHGDFKIDNLVFHRSEPKVIGILE